MLSDHEPGFTSIPAKNTLIISGFRPEALYKQVLHFLTAMGVHFPTSSPTMYLNQWKVQRSLASHG